MKDIEKTVEKLIDKQKICYITSIDSEGFPSTKAMLSPRERKGLKEFYLSTNTSSLKVRFFKKNSKACLYFCDKRFFRGVSLKGEVQVLEDQTVKDRIWRVGDTMYYKKGKTDPDYCVLKFTASSLRFYSHFKSVDIEF